MNSVILDTETTGLDPADQVISFAAVKIVDRKITDKLSFFAKPTCRIHPDAEKVHGISLQRLANEQPFSSYINRINAFCDGADEFVAHNAPFDMGMLDAEYSRANAGEFSKKAKVVDTLAIARRTLGLRRNRLGDVADKFGVTYDATQAHGAVYDTEVLAEVYLRMTAGQVKMELPQPPKPVVALPQTQQIKRIVFFPSEAEMKAHAEFCKANKITVF